MTFKMLINLDYRVFIDVSLCKPKLKIIFGTKSREGNKACVLYMIYHKTFKNTIAFYGSY